MEFFTKPSGAENNIDAEMESKFNRAKYLSNSIKMVGNKAVPSLFGNYYSWLTNSFNLYKATVGVIVNAFSMTGDTALDINKPEDKKQYVNALETIAYGIIETHSESQSLGLFEYINYQVKALEKLFKTDFGTKDDNMIQTYKNLFYVQDLDEDGKLNIEDLAVSIAYLDMQDGVLDGKLRYNDAISLGEDINTETGRFKMRLELNHLKEFLFE